jgi:hypothetical protein
MSFTPPSIERLADYIGADVIDDAPRLGETLAVAVGLTEEAFSSAYKEVPQWAFDTVVLDAAKNIWNRRNNASGGGLNPISGFEPQVQANNPLQKSRSIINLFVVPL